LPSMQSSYNFQLEEQQLLVVEHNSPVRQLLVVHN
jgi:hypothetical protein